MDETTPYMHICSVPITSDGRLSAKIIFNRKALLQLQSKGLDVQRGEVGSKKIHLNTQEFKIKTKKEELEKAINDLNIKSKVFKKVRSNISELEQTSLKKGFIGSKVTLQEAAYNKIINLAKNEVLNEDLLNDLKKITCLYKVIV